MSLLGAESGNFLPVQHGYKIHVVADLVGCRIAQPHHIPVCWLRVINRLRALVQPSNDLTQQDQGCQSFLGVGLWSNWGVELDAKHFLGSELKVCLGRY
jgi:hypothetical protein